MHHVHPDKNQPMDNVVDFINVNRDRYIEEMKRYLAIPSISALPEHKADVRTCAEWTADEMRRIGLQNVRLEETPGHPVVYGEWLGAAGAPTILFYGHYDVQPVGHLNEWSSGPFAATIQDGKLYARGAANSKGDLVARLAAVEAYQKTFGKLPVTLRFIVERGTAVADALARRDNSAGETNRDIQRESDGRVAHAQERGEALEEYALDVKDVTADGVRVDVTVTPLGTANTDARQLTVRIAKDGTIALKQPASAQTTGEQREQAAGDPSCEVLAWIVGSGPSLRSSTNTSVTSSFDAGVTWPRHCS